MNNSIKMQFFDIPGIGEMGIPKNTPEELEKIDTLKNKGHDCLTTLITLLDTEVDSEKETETTVEQITVIRDLYQIVMDINNIAWTKNRGIALVKGEELNDELIPIFNFLNTYLDVSKKRDDILTILFSHLEKNHMTSTLEETDKDENNQDEAIL